MLARLFLLLSSPYDPSTQALTDENGIAILDENGQPITDEG